MAKNKDKKKDNKKDKTKGAAKSIEKDLVTGGNLADKLGFNKSLSRIDANIPDDQRRYMESLAAMSDPSSAAFVGKRSDEEKGGLSYLENLMSSAGVRSADMTSTLDKLKSGWENDGKRTADTADVIARARNQADIAGKRSADMQGVLDLMKGGLAGLNATENQAIREQAQKEVDRKRQAALEQVQATARMGGMKGGAANAGARAANRDAMMAQADMEQKNLISNIGIQDSRRTGYANTLGTAENDEFTRGNTALNTYGSQVQGAEQNEAQRMQSARDAYRNQLSDTEQNEFTNKSTAGVNFNNQVNNLRTGEFDRLNRTQSQYGDSLANRNNYFLDATKTNLGQERTEQAARVAGSTGLAGMIETERQKRRDRAGSRGRSSSSGSTNSNGSTSPNKPYDPMELYNDIQKIYQDKGVI